MHPNSTQLITFFISLSLSLSLSTIAMNGYSKMRVKTNFMASNKSRSMDLCNLNFSPPHGDQECPNTPPKLQVEKMTHGGQGGGEDGSHGLHQGERFGVMLSSNSSSSASQRFRRSSNNDEKKSNASASASGTALQGAVRRAFSMRKSNFVGDGYWRIHDTGDVEADQVIQEEEADEEEPTTTTTTRRIKKRGNIFRACKRFFKF